MMVKLSPLFDIKTTSYGGRGCFANQDLKAGTVVLECTSPISSTILRGFKKEVCSWCFHYENGSNLKFKVEGLSHFYFCSQSCIEQFMKYDVDHVYQDSIVRAEEQYLRLLKNKKSKPEEAEGEKVLDINQETVDTVWDEVKQWEIMISKCKPLKRLNKLPSELDENELMELKYAVGCLFDMYKEGKNEENGEVDGQVDRFELLNREIFKQLQSDELLKLSKYPYLLESYTRVYKFLKLTALEPLQKYLSTDSFRDLIGKNLSNAFGIWSEGSSDREFFGYSVYPTASFFNHSCAPNLMRQRVGNALHFTTRRDLTEGEEICISYGNASDEDLLTRQQELNEWHFKCQCTKCVEDFEDIKESTLSTPTVSVL